MLSEKTQNLLGECLFAVASYLKEIDSFKRAICESEGFSIYSLFNALDGSQVGSIGPNDLQSHMNPEYVGKLISYFNRNNDGRLDFSEFSDFVLPCDNPCYAALSLNSDIGQSLPIDELKELFSKEIDLIKLVEHWMAKLQANRDFNEMSAFLVLSYSYSSFNAQSLSHFYKNICFEIPETYIKLLVWRLDKSKTGSVSYKDFVDFLKWEKPKTQFQKTLKAVIINDCPAVPQRFSENSSPAEYFEAMIKQTYQTEELLRSLIDIPSFNLDQTYAMFDTENKGYISTEELKQTLNFIGVRNFESADLITKNGKIDFNSFYRILSPSNHSLYVELKRRQKTESRISAQVVEKLRWFFEQLLRNELKLFNMRKEFTVEFLKECFMNLDHEHTGFLRFSAMESYLKARNSVVTDYDLELIMKKLDVDKDGKVSYPDYISTLLY